VFKSKVHQIIYFQSETETYGTFNNEPVVTSRNYLFLLGSELQCIHTHLIER